MEKTTGSKYEITVKIEGEIIGVRQVQDHGRVQIPKKIREKLKLQDGDSVYWIEDFSGKMHILKTRKLQQ